MKFTIFQDTRLGKRPYNQDRLGHWRTPESLLLVVADGMGGHAHGEVAAQIAVRRLGAPSGARRSRGSPTRTCSCSAHRRARTRMVLREAAAPAARTPRTTVVACIVQDGHAYWSHVGDSRLYLMREGRHRARTRDHTLVQQLIDAGRHPRGGGRPRTRSATASCSASAAAARRASSRPRTRGSRENDVAAALLRRLLGAAHAAPAADALLGRPWSRRFRSWSSSPRRAPGRTATTSRCWR